MKVKVFIPGVYTFYLAKSLYIFGRVPNESIYISHGKKFNDMNIFDVWLSDAGDYSLTDIVVTMWEGGTADVDVESPYYLNQSENL